LSDDVVVVGSGAAALSAALSAAVRGARVTVLERADLFGGTSAISGGGMWLPSNGLDPDFADSADDARRYVRHLTLGLVDDRVIDRYVQEAPGIPAFLSAHTTLSFWTQFGRPDYHADFDGSSGTSRTVFPDTFDTALLRDLKTKLRRPHWPGGIPPLRHDELQQFVARGDPDGWKLLGRAGDQRERADPRHGRQPDSGAVRRRERGGQHLRGGVPGWRRHPRPRGHLRLRRRADAHLLTLTS
jgi:3-oxosteroid 1-dehydrogenase